MLALGTRRGSIMLMPVGKLTNRVEQRQPPLSVAFNIAVQTVVRRLLPCGFDVAPEPRDVFDEIAQHFKPDSFPRAPSSLAELTAHVARTGRILVSGEHSGCTIYGDPEINYAFRAWHDWHHWKGQFAFDEKGERLTYEAQARDLDTIYGPRTAAPLKRILHAEVIGQWEHERAWGAFPVDQRAFVAAYLAHGSRAVLLRNW